MENFAGLTPVPVTEANRGAEGVGMIVVTADARVGDNAAVTASTSALYWPGNAPTPGDPCLLEAGETPGRQGAPRVGDVCASYPQADGTVVWLHKTTQPASPEMGESYLVTAVHFRADRLKVEVVVGYWKPWEDQAGIARYADAALVKAVTDPRLLALERDPASMVNEGKVG